MPNSTLFQLVFALSAFVLLISSLAVVLARNPVRATLLLILSFLPTALIYILLQASFVGVLQILVYAGAIMMLFTFVIMMINPAPKGGETSGSTVREEGPPGLFASLATLAVLGGLGALVIPLVYRAAAETAVTGATVPGAVKPGFGDLSSLADLLFKDPADNPLTVSFELISFLILVGIIAALNFSRRKAALPPVSEAAVAPPKAGPARAPEAGRAEPALEKR